MGDHRLAQTGGVEWTGGVGVYLISSHRGQNPTPNFQAGQKGKKNPAEKFQADQKNPGKISGKKSWSKKILENKNPGDNFYAGQKKNPGK